jgi:transcriptional repressor NrdR
MKCPFCGFPETQVTDSRVTDEGDAVRRRRRCQGCDKRYTTYETAEVRAPQIVKSNSSRSPFDKEKIRTSFLRALHKRPVPTTLVDEAINRVVQKIMAMGEREITSLQIGEMVMQELSRLDKVAYIRFASVYRSFQDVADFREAIREVTKDKASGKKMR